MPRPLDWTENASATNATATATHAAVADQRHVLTYVAASFDDSTAGALLTIKKGSDTEIEHYIHGADVIPLELRGENNEAVSAELAAGGSGVTGYVGIIGYTE